MTPELENEFLEEHDEVTLVLAGLRALLVKVTSPVVRACLEEAHDDIIHLTSHDALPLVDEIEPEAA